MLAVSEAHARGTGTLAYSAQQPGVVERDTSPTLFREVEGSAAEGLRATRRADSGRDIEHFDGSSWATFLSGEFPIEMHAVSNGTDTLVCAPVATDFPSTAEVLTECAVREGTGFSPADRQRFEGAPGSFVRDVCPDASGFEVLVLQAANPFGVPAEPGDAIPAGCVAYHWSSGDGWVQGEDEITCACDHREGSECENPCFAGAAHWVDGACEPDDPSTALCDDGDPMTIDHCSGTRTRCTPEHPDYMRALVMETPEIGPGGNVTFTESEIRCPLGQDDCHCTCLPGELGCETVTETEDLVDAMCSYVQLEPSTGVFMRGDVNGDDTVDLSDAQSLFNALYLGGPLPACDNAADVDDSGVVELTDGIALLNFLFNEGPPPAEPFRSCGVDRTPSDLTCGTSTGSCCELQINGCA